MRIEKKIRPEYFKEIISGAKNFELRLADWECRVGDVLVLKEWDPATKDYTGEVVEKEVTCVVKTKGQQFWPEDDVAKYGYQIIGFK